MGAPGAGDEAPRGAEWGEPYSRKLVVATTNRHKLIEIARLLDRLDWTVEAIAAMDIAAFGESRGAVS